MKLTEKETEILEILDENSRVDAETIAKMANIPAEEVKSIIEKLEKESHTPLTSGTLIQLPGICISAQRLHQSRHFVSE